MNTPPPLFRLGQLRGSLGRGRSLKKLTNCINSIKVIQPQGIQISTEGLLELVARGLRGRKEFKGKVWSFRERALVECEFSVDSTLEPPTDHIDEKGNPLDLSFQQGEKNITIDSSFAREVASYCGPKFDEEDFKEQMKNLRDLSGSGEGSSTWALINSF